MRGSLEEIRAAGAELVFVGTGSPGLARSFQKRFAPDCLVLSDPSRECYAALGLKRSVAATLSPRSAVGAIRSSLRGHLQGPVAGDPWQQGGLFAVLRGGRIAFAQRNRDAADRPQLDEALRSLDSEPRSRSVA